MSLQQFVDTYNGQTIGTGQCGELVDLYLQKVLNCYTTYGAAIDYWQNGIPGFSIVTQPQPGDVVCYNAHGPVLPDGTLAYPYGHIAVYAGNGQVFEQNADPDGSPAHLFARANTYLLGYLRKGGEQDMVDDPTARAMLSATMLLAQDGATPDRQPTLQEVENLIGRTPLDAMNQIMSYQPWQHNYAKVKYYDADVANAGGAANDKLNQIKQIVN